MLCLDANITCPLHAMLIHRSMAGQQRLVLRLYCIAMCGTAACISVFASMT